MQYGLSRNREFTEQKCVQNSCHCFAGFDWNCICPPNLVTLSAPTGDVCGAPLPHFYPESCVLHPASFMAESFCRCCRATKLVSFRVGRAPKYNLSFWSNEFGKGSWLLRKIQSILSGAVAREIRIYAKMFFLRNKNGKPGEKPPQLAV